MRTNHSERLAHFFETLEPASLARFDDVFDPQARFRDPFNDVCGVDAIREVFRHMFTQCDEPRFEVVEQIADDRFAYLRWHFRYRTRRDEHCIEGVSRIRFSDEGRVIDHRDFWDPAQHIYENIPLLGWILRMLRRRLSAPTDRTDRQSVTTQRYIR